MKKCKFKFCDLIITGLVVGFIAILLISCCQPAHAYFGGSTASIVLEDGHRRPMQRPVPKVHPIRNEKDVIFGYTKRPHYGDVVGTMCVNGEIMVTVTISGDRRLTVNLLNKEGNKKTCNMR
jgi:hypothetical protein